MKKKCINIESGDDLFLVLRNAATQSKDEHGYNKRSKKSPLPYPKSCDASWVYYSGGYPKVKAVHYRYLLLSECPGDHARAVAEGNKLTNRN